jgi:hypothetical protein
VVRNVSKELAFAPGCATSGLESSGMTAAAMWRPTIAVDGASGNPPAVNPAAVNPAAVSIGAAGAAQHQKTVAMAKNRQLATLHTQKQYVVTAPDAGRGNKGTSPWGFPV